MIQLTIFWLPCLSIHWVLLVYADQFCITFAWLSSSCFRRSADPTPVAISVVQDLDNISRLMLTGLSALSSIGVGMLSILKDVRLRLWFLLFDDILKLLLGKLMGC
ncbi:hypothetical protein QVD17_06397 [Tagetes erecta]|uniref:Uncharacterized protein n=1 Tax=Tagetes erecta TaxID=13708 RepID=A0AAD8PB92_TARER|nr:hypothetical protein QVD17_06397 [Tagetes erecta]